VNLLALHSRGLFVPFTHLTFDGPIATLSLDHPQGNCINFGMRQELLASIRLVADSTARVLLIRSEGRDFSLGGDVRDWSGVSSHELRPKLETFAEALNQLEKLSIPTVAAVRGRCMGGGLELILSCDLVVAGKSAAFGCPDAMLGIITLQGGLIQLAQRVGRARALEFVFLSDLHNADEMADLNLVNRVVPDDQLEDAAGALVDRLAIGPPAAYATTKLLLRAWAAGGINTANSVLYDVSMPIFDDVEVQDALRAAAAAAEIGRPLSGRVFGARNAMVRRGDIGGHE
jgi:enoyl-CoA hydratase/carnithine racemase